MHLNTIKHKPKKSETLKTNHGHCILEEKGSGLAHDRLCRLCNDLPTSHSRKVIVFKVEMNITWPGTLFCVGTLMINYLYEVFSASLVE